MSLLNTGLPSLYVLHPLSFFPFFILFINSFLELVFATMNVALHSVRADYVPPIVFLSFVLKSFLPVATCKSRWWSCFVSCANHPGWYATFNQPALISDTRTSPGLQWKVCNSDVIASKRDRSTFLQDQANCWQATQMHKPTSNNPACTYERLCKDMW